MGLNLSHVTSSGRFPRLLIAESNFSTVESLIRTFGDRRLDLDFDVCTSRDQAVMKLFHSPPPYQVVISNVQLAEMDDFLLLKHNQTLQPSVPFVVTTTASETEAARRVLAQGAFDLIPSPLDYEQTVRTIRVALWQGKLRNLIARKEKAMEQYRQHLADYPDDSEKREESFHRALLVIEKTISSVTQTILRLEESTVCFSDFATKVEHHVRVRALERLDSLYAPPRARDTTSAHH